MKRTLKTFRVFALATCLTSFHFSSLALAQDEFSSLDTTVSRYQPKRQRTELATPSTLLAPQRGVHGQMGYLYNSSDFTVKSSNNVTSESKGQSHRGSAALAAALTPHFYGGLSVAYSSGESDMTTANAYKSKTLTSGESEPEIFMGGRYNTGNISLVGQLNYQFGIGEATSKETKSTYLSSEYEESAKEGRSSLTPSLAIFTNNKSNFIFGAQMSYEIKENGRSNYRDLLSGMEIKTDISGGNAFSTNLFLESPQVGHSFGAAISYTRNEGTTRKSITQNRTTDDVETASLIGFGNLRLAKNLSVIPALAYSRILTEQQSVDQFQKSEITNQSLWSGMIMGQIYF